jgi:hypothetical protein
VFQPGTVIEGTHDPVDILAATAPLVRSLSESTVTYVMEQIGQIQAGRSNDSELTDEDKSAVLEVVFNVLTAHAPDGHYFGAHPDDGADFGFWPLPE